jgi:hypothetical protein
MRLVAQTSLLVVFAATVKHNQIKSGDLLTLMYY